MNQSQLKQINQVLPFLPDFEIKDLKTISIETKMVPMIAVGATHLQMLHCINEFLSAKEALGWTNGTQLFDNITDLFEDEKEKESLETLIAKKNSRSVGTFKVVLKEYIAHKFANNNRAYTTHKTFLCNIKKMRSLTVQEFISKLQYHNTSLLPLLPGSPPTNASFSETDLKEIIHDAMPIDWKEQFYLQGLETSTQTIPQLTDFFEKRDTISLRDPRRDQYEKVLDEDTFSLMMTSKVCTIGYLCGVLTSLFQLTIIGILMYTKVKKSWDSEGNISVPFGAPIRTDLGTSVGQFLAVLMMLFNQKDASSAFEFLILFRFPGPNQRNNGFYALLVEDDEEETLDPIHNPTTKWKWFFRANLPNILKLFQGIMVFVLTIITVIEADDLFEVLTGYAALYFLSDIDNQVFSVVKRGFCGNSLMFRAYKVKEIVLEVEKPAGLCQVVYYIVLAITLLVGLTIFKLDQGSVELVRKKYPECTNIKDIMGKSMEEDDYHKKIGDGHCDGWLNTANCGFDDGDCAKFNLDHPNCPVRDPKLLNDGFCNGGLYASIGCNRDDGDCDNCPRVPTSEKDTAALATADFDGDGWIDILVGNCFMGNQILWNNGSGMFNPEDITELDDSYGYDQCTSAIAVADLDDDGLIDIVVATKYDKMRRNRLALASANLILWNNGGRMNFTQEVLPESNSIDSQAVKVVDLNNDTFPEIIFGNARGYNNTIFWNNGNKTFDKIAMPLTPNNPSTDFSSSEMYNTTTILVVPALYDLNEDYFLNIIYFGNYNQINTAYYGGSYQYWYGTFKEYKLTSASNYPSKTVSSVRLPVETLTKDESLSTLFLNDDGYPDSGNAGFSENIEMREARIIDVANMDNNGLEELVTAGGFGVSNRVFFLFEGNYPTIKSSVELPCTKNMDTQAIALADLDKDGNIDVVIGNRMQRNQVLLNFLGDGKTYKQPGDDVNESSRWLPEKSMGYKYPNCFGVLSLVDDICDHYTFDQVNNEECGYDNGRCIKFNEFMKRHPNCGNDNGGNVYVRSDLIGDGICQDNEVNTEECGWDDGDCEDFDKKKYPDCTKVPENKYEATSLGNGFCNGFLNTEECGYDGGDCNEFNAEFPGCVVDDITKLGDGICHGKPYNSKACDFDGGDCLQFNEKYKDCDVENPYNVGDGKCHGKPYNSEACDFDGGDCLQFNEKYRDCDVQNPSSVGDGLCNYPRGRESNSQECGWDGGDCPYVVEDQSTLDILLQASNITDIYNSGIRIVKVTTSYKTGVADGVWVKRIRLPKGNEVAEGSKFQIKCNSFDSVEIVYYFSFCGRDFSKKVDYGEELALVVVGNNWYDDDGSAVLFVDCEKT